MSQIKPEPQAPTTIIVAQPIFKLSLATVARRQINTQSQIFNLRKWYLVRRDKIKQLFTKILAPTDLITYRIW